MMRAWVVLAALVLAGCAEPAGPRALTPDQAANIDLGEFAGIQGVAVDDRLRPIASATVTIIETGTQTTADLEGWFYFDRLTPGHYTLRISDDGDTVGYMEADALAGEWAVAEFLASEQQGEITTTFLAYFETCTIDVASETTAVCHTVTPLVGLGPERPETLDYAGRNVTGLFVEFLFENNGNYDIQLRDGDRIFSSAEIRAGNWVILQLRPDLEDPSVVGGTSVWTPEDELEVAVTVRGQVVQDDVSAGLIIGTSAQIAVFAFEDVDPEETICHYCG